MTGELSCAYCRFPAVLIVEGGTPWPASGGFASVPVCGAHEPRARAVCADSGAVRVTGLTPRCQQLLLDFCVDGAAGEPAGGSR